MEQKTFRVNYYDSLESSAYGLLSCTNFLLESYGLEIELKEDGEVRDGYKVYEVSLIIKS